MAIITGITTGNMSCILTRRFNTVMAVYARADNARVVEVRGSPGHRRMTVLAEVATRYMCRVFARRVISVMA